MFYLFDIKFNLTNSRRGLEHFNKRWAEEQLETGYRETSSKYPDNKKLECCVQYGTGVVHSVYVDGWLLFTE